MSRVTLADALPLRTPLVVQIFPIYRCNFRCSYCHFSIPPQERQFVTDREVMPLDLFQKCVSDMECFEDRIRVLRFVGMGEPLLHPNIADMVWMAKKADIAETVEVLTNGYSLTKEASDSLVDAGLDRLVISLQGTNPESYKRISGVRLEWSKFVGQIRYIYGRGKCHVHVKIIDIALSDVDEFKRIFGPVSDSLSIERAGPIYPGVDTNDAHALGDTSQYGRGTFDFRICPQAFATMQVNPDGNVVPCYSIDYPCIVGNANHRSLVSIWKGEELRQFRLRMLSGMWHASEACRICKIIRHRIHPEDVIDGVADRLKEVYK